MSFKVIEVKPDSDYWQDITKMFPCILDWQADPEDDGDYIYLAAVDEQGEYLGGCFVDISELECGPLGECRVGFLEEIEVLEPHRNKGIGYALIREVLERAWAKGALNVRWVVDYDNAAGIALYRKFGFGFVPLEDKSDAEPLREYAYVAVNPASICK